MRDHELLRRFLLGELGEKKAERVEKRLLKNDELFDLCETVEAELLGAVVRGELAPAERERVLQRLATSPQGRARLALARELIAEADRQRSTEPMPAPLSFRPRSTFAARPAVRWAVAAGLALTLGGGAAWWINTRPEGANQVVTIKKPDGRPEVEINRTPPPAITMPDTEETPLDNEPVLPSPADQIAEEDEPPPSGDEAPALKTYVIQLAALTRGGEGEEEVLPKVDIPAGTVRVHFQMDAKRYEHRYESYWAAVTRDGEGEVWSEPNLKPEPMTGGPVLVLDVPAGKLRAGIYKVEIQGNPAEGAPEFLMDSVFEVTHGENSVSNQ